MWISLVSRGRILGCSATLPHVQLHSTCEANLAFMSHNSPVASDDTLVFQVGHAINRKEGKSINHATSMILGLPGGNMKSLLPCALN